MAYKLLITASAEQDLDGVVVYIIRDLDNLPAAAKLLDEVEERYANLEENPFLYEPCRDARLKMSGYRKVVVGRYAMIYRVDQKRQVVYVERFFSEL